MARPKRQRKKVERKAPLIDQMGKEAYLAMLAKAVVSPPMTAAMTIRFYGNISGEPIDLALLYKELSDQCETVRGGDLQRIEGMLTAHAHTLDAIFNDLAKRGAVTLGKCTETADRFLRLALKAQGQCRATLETLATIKSPPMVFARQANITSGPQQVNNRVSPRARTRESKSGPNKLLEKTDGQRLDPGAAGQAIGSDPAMASVGAFDRPQNKGG